MKTALKCLKESFDNRKDDQWHAGPGVAALRRKGEEDLSALKRKHSRQLSTEGDYPLLIVATSKYYSDKLGNPHPRP